MCPPTPDRFSAAPGPSALGLLAGQATWRRSKARWPGWLTASRLGWAVAVAVLSIYAGLFGRMLEGSPYWSPTSSVAEQANYYQVARNFNRFGFGATFFLHDLSSASNPVFHPYVYTHMPPGPEIVTALVMRFAGENYRVIRLVFGAVFFAGLVCYLGFVRIVLGRLGLGGAGLALLFLNPFWMMHAADHPAYSPFPLLAFLPLLLLNRYYRTGRRLPLLAALLVVFVSSVYLVYQNLLMLVAGWIGLTVFRLVRFERRHLLGFLAMAGLGIGLHALQSVVFLGPSLFATETALGLTNRIFGEPTRQGLRAFYRSIDVVHHGAFALDPSGIATVVASSLRVLDPTPSSWRIGDTTVTAALLALLLAGTTWIGRDAGGARGAAPPGSARSPAAVARFMGKLGVWTCAVVGIPLLVFPAYSRYYALAGMEEFFVSLFGVAAYASMILCCGGLRSCLDRAAGAGAFLSARRLGGAGLALVLLTAVGAGMFRTAILWHHRLAAAQARIARGDPLPAALEHLGRRFPGTVMVTNAYPTLVGLFTREAVVGGCESSVLRPDGALDPGQCHLAMIKGFGRKPTVTPTYFALFGESYVGFRGCDRRCVRDLRAGLGSRYPLVEENALYAVFDLTGRLPATAGRARS